MSTKCSVAYGDNVHYYADCFDDENMFLELRGPLASFSCSPHIVTVAIPRWLAAALGMPSEFKGEKCLKIEDPQPPSGGQ